ncbi:MAG: hypothetical protein AAFR61_29945, partial [Bacteroidota bacterium]
MAEIFPTVSAQRMANIQAGLAELRQWLEDVSLVGLAELTQQPSAYWEQRAARLVDAQAGGLAESMRQIPTMLLAEDWQEQLLRTLARFYLFIQGFEQFEQLSPALQADLLQRVGVNVKKAVLMEQEGEADHWLVLGQRTIIGERLDLRRSWIKGLHSHQEGMILEYAFASQGFDSAISSGHLLSGKWVYYPSSRPLRGMFKAKEKLAQESPAPQALPDFAAFFDHYSESLQALPFQRLVLCHVNDVRLVRSEEQWWIRDKNQISLPLDEKFVEKKGWEL